MDEMISTLNEIGLSPKEIRVYLALLTLGATTVNRISEKADLIRTTTYDILKGLREQGLVSSFVKNRILHFEAINPTVILDRLKEKCMRFEKILPHIKTLRRNIPEKPVIELCEGKEGIKAVWQDILHERKQLSAVSNTKFLVNVLPLLVPRFIQQRVKEGIGAKLLTERTKESVRIMKHNDKQGLRETRFIPQLKKIPITQYIYGDSVAIEGSDPHNPLGIIIRHQDFAKEQQVLFDILWTQAQR